MVWNPGSRLRRVFDFGLGGQQPIYVFTDSVTINNQVLDLTYAGDDIEDYPLLSVVDAMDANGSALNTINFFSSMDWVSYSMTTPGNFYENYSGIPSDALVELRMAQPYRNTGGGVNDGDPIYEFTTDGLEVEIGNNLVANEALDLIRVVPNPYNGSSQYEDSQLDNLVKITNLPSICEINIFMTNGTLIRNINKDNSLAFIEWDLTNDFSVPISSGIYLIHVNVPGVGEKVIKWMGTMRPVDLNAF
jgi:hypothetical protein